MAHEDNAAAGAVTEWEKQSRLAHEHGAAARKAIEQAISAAYAWGRTWGRTEEPSLNELLGMIERRVKALPVDITQRIALRLDPEELLKIGRHRLESSGYHVTESNYASRAKAYKEGYDAGLKHVVAVSATDAEVVAARVTARAEGYTAGHKDAARALRADLLTRFTVEHLSEYTDAEVFAEAARRAQAAHPLPVSS